MGNGRTFSVFLRIGKFLVCSRIGIDIRTGRTIMQFSQTLLAWIEQRRADVFTAAVVGAGAVAGVYQGYAGRLPAMRDFSSLEEARGWVSEQAGLLRVAVNWLDEAPEGYGAGFGMGGRAGLGSVSAG
jgi:hypothetical protein